MLKSDEMARNPEVENEYRKHLKNIEGICVFCRLEENSPREVIEESSAFMVVVNRFPYEVWDRQPVKSHFMILPKRHVESTAEFSELEASDYIRLLQKYEVAGYSFYGRTKTNTARTVTHQHTHLIKT